MNLLIFPRLLVTSCRYVGLISRIKQHRKVLAVPPISSARFNVVTGAVGTVAEQLYWDRVRKPVTVVSRANGFLDPLTSLLAKNPFGQSVQRPPDSRDFFVLIVRRVLRPTIREPACNYDESARNRIRRVRKQSYRAMLRSDDACLPSAEQFSSFSVITVSPHKVQLAPINIPNR